VGYRNPLKRSTNDSVVWGAPKGRRFQKRRRTRPECNNS
jgi:hypothetical protein